MDRMHHSTLSVHPFQLQAAMNILNNHKHVASKACQSTLTFSRDALTSKKFTSLRPARSAISFALTPISSMSARQSEVFFREAAAKVEQPETLRLVNFLHLRMISVNVSRADFLAPFHPASLQIWAIAVVVKWFTNPRAGLDDDIIMET